MNDLNDLPATLNYKRIEKLVMCVIRTRFIGPVANAASNESFRARYGRAQLGSFKFELFFCLLIALIEGSHRPSMNFSEFELERIESAWANFEH